MPNDTLFGPKVNNVVSIEDLKNNEELWLESDGKKLPFTTLPNNMLQGNLSMDAQALITYLCSLPSDWKLNREHLKKHFNIGDWRLRNAINELKARGYMKSFRVKGEKGRFSTHKTVWSITPRFNSEPVDKKMNNLGSSVDEMTALLETLTIPPKNHDRKNRIMDEVLEPLAIHPQRDFSTRGKTEAHTNYCCFNNNLVVNNNNNSPRAREDVIEAEGVIESLRKLAISGVHARAWIKKFGIGKVKEKIEMFNSINPSRIHKTPGAWICAALKGDYQPLDKKTPSGPYAGSLEETQQRFQEWDKHFDAVKNQRELPGGFKSIWELLRHHQSVEN